METGVRLPTLYTSPQIKIQKKGISQLGFLNSEPISHRERISLFADDTNLAEATIPRRLLCTPPEIRRKQNEIDSIKSHVHTQQCQVAIAITERIKKDANGSSINQLKLIRHYSKLKQQYLIDQRAKKEFEKKDQELADHLRHELQQIRAKLYNDKNDNIPSNTSEPLVKSKTDIKVVQAMNKVNENAVDLDKYGDEEVIVDNEDTITSVSISESESSVSFSLPVEAPYSTSIVDDQLQPVFDKYFGINAREEFYSLFKKSNRDFYVCGNQVEVIPEEMNTPRNMFLREQQKLNLPPLSLILRDKNEVRGINLANRGLGDSNIAPLVNILESIPGVETIDVSDNRLTDQTIMPLVLKLGLFPSLTNLNLSFNDVDESSMTLRNFIISSECKLRKLLINGSDVDDKECVELVDALKRNSTIIHLGLAKNKIGESELLNVVMPDIVTGGEALASLLQINNTLKILDLSWNAIRLASSEQFGSALEFNKSLIDLDISYNNFGDLGSQYLGRSLKYNNTLIRLNLSYNSITPKAACVIANALNFNRRLKYINFDGNYIGYLGSQALVGAIQRVVPESEENVLSLSFEKCDVEKQDFTLFNPNSPGGTYVVNLTDPYGAMVVDEIFFLANFRAGVNILSLEYKSPTEKTFSTVALERGSKGVQKSKFSQKVYLSSSQSIAKFLLADPPQMSSASASLIQLLNLFDFSMADDMRKQVLQSVHTNWLQKKVNKHDLMHVILFEIFIALFHINDVDNSGTLELDEFLEILRHLGRDHFDRTLLRNLMAFHDQDESGNIDCNEFGLIMVNDFCRTYQPRAKINEKATGRSWKIPREGHCKIVVQSECELPTMYDVGGDYGVVSIIKTLRNAKTMEQREVIFHHAITSPYYYYNSNHAQQLYEQTRGLPFHNIDVIAMILPQIVSSDQCLSFINNNLTDDEKLELRLLLGPLYNVYTSNATGHYLIDLTNNHHVRGAKKLAALSVTESKFTSSVGINVSQKGNGSNFRNELLMGSSIANGKDLYVDVDGKWFGNCPKSGNLRCDFVSTIRPREGVIAMSDNRFRQMCTKLGFNDILAYINDLRKLHKSGGYKEILVQHPLTVVHVKEYFFEYMESCYHYHDVYPEERVIMEGDSNKEMGKNVRTPSKSAGGKRKKKKKKNIIEHDNSDDEDDYSDKPKSKPSITYIHPVFPLMYKKLLQLQLHATSCYITVDQVITLMSYFPNLNGTCYIRVQILLAVWSRITDLNMLYKIVHELFTHEERSEALHRIGILNLYDPSVVDYDYNLDLRRFDHREYAKILIALAINEPGDNFQNQQFRWTKYDDPVPGWVVPATWQTPDESGNGDGGPRHHGWFTFTYCSQGEGFSVDIHARNELRKRTLSGVKRIL